MTDDMYSRSITFLNKEQKNLKIKLQYAIKRNAPEIDIKCIRKKLEEIDHLMELAIKEKVETSNALEMTKLPADIKRSIGLCDNAYGCLHCAYLPEKTSELGCVTMRDNDTRTYIEQLEANNRMLHRCIKLLAKENEMQENHIESLNEQISFFKAIASLNEKAKEKADCKVDRTEPPEEET